MSVRRMRRCECVSLLFNILLYCTLPQQVLLCARIRQSSITYPDGLHRLNLPQSAGLARQDATDVNCQRRDIGPQAIEYLIEVAQLYDTSRLLRFVVLALQYKIFLQSRGSIYILNVDVLEGVSVDIVKKGVRLTSIHTFSSTLTKESTQTLLHILCGKT